MNDANFESKSEFFEEDDQSNVSPTHFRRRSVHKKTTVSIDLSKSDVIETSNVSRSIDGGGNKKINEYIIIKRLGK